MEVSSGRAEKFSAAASSTFLFAPTPENLLQGVSIGCPHA